MNKANDKNEKKHNRTNLHTHTHTNIYPIPATIKSTKYIFERHFLNFFLIISILTEKKQQRKRDQKTVVTVPCICDVFMYMKNARPFVFFSLYTMHELWQFFSVIYKFKQKFCWLSCFFFFLQIFALRFVFFFANGAWKNLHCVAYNMCNKPKNFCWNASNTKYDHITRKNATYF